MTRRTALIAAVTAGGLTLLAACTSSGDAGRSSAASTQPAAQVTVTESSTAPTSTAPTSTAPTSTAPTSKAATSTANPATSPATGPATGPAGTVTSTVTGTGGSGPGPSTTVAQCAESQLRASIDPRPVRNSTTTGPHADFAIIVDFRNTSGTPCRMYGYPGAALLDSTGKQVKQAQRTIRGQLLGLPTSQSTLPTVILRPGAYASAGIEGVNQQQVGAAQAGCAARYPKLLLTPPNTRVAVPFAVSWPVCFSFTVHPTDLESHPPSQ